LAIYEASIRLFQWTLLSNIDILKLYREGNFLLEEGNMNRKNIQSMLMVICLLLSLFLISDASVETKGQFIDVLLLIDSSGSMNWSDRDPEKLRIQGSKLFIDLCEKSDRIGVIDFSTDANIVFPLYEIFSSQDKEVLKRKIDTIEAKGKFTDITLVLQIALKEMTRARSDGVKAVILLTDGEIDPDPSNEAFSPYNQDYLREIHDAAGNKRKIARIKEKYKSIVAPISKEILRNKILPNYEEQKIPIFAVAFGRGADVQLLKEVADFTATEIGVRNYYFIKKASFLQPVFSEIVEQLKKTREKIVEEKVEFVGEEIVYKINIDDFIREVNFKFIFGKKVTPSVVQISLRDPNGDVVSRTTKREGIGHIFEKGYELYNIFNPLPGTWEVIIGGGKNVKLDITISTWGRTELKILTEVMKSEYSIDEPIPILSSLQIEGKRITSEDFLKNLKFLAWIENPKNKVEKLELYDDGNHSDKSAGDGIYGNLFTNTSITGDYIIKIVAKGITKGMKRFNFTRETEYRVRVLTKEKPVSPIKMETKKTEGKPGGFPDFLKITLIVIGVVVVLLIVALLLKRSQRRAVTEEEIEEPEPPQPWVGPTVTLKIKDGSTEIVGSRQIKHSSIDERNLIIRREGEQFFILTEAGSLELNNRVVTEEREVKEGDIIKIGELYYEVQLKPDEDKITLLGITKEQASLKTKEER